VIKLREGEKRDISVRVSRTRGLETDVTLTNPQRRILDADRAVITSFDWATASWDSEERELYAAFDSTATGLATPGIYYMQLRGTIGTEVYAREIRVDVLDWGP